MSVTSGGYPLLAYTQPVNSVSRTVTGSLISEYPGYSLMSDRDSVRVCFLMILFFFEKHVSHLFTGWLYVNVIIHLIVGESPGYLPRCIRGSVNILVYSPPLR